MEVEPLEFESRNIKMKHIKGQKDEYKVNINFKTDSWSPTNEEIFALLHMWYVSEEAAFSSGYGRKMPWFYNTLCSFNREGYLKAKEANKKKGFEQVEYFEEMVSTYADDVIHRMKKLKKECGVESDEEFSETLFNY